MSKLQKFLVGVGVLAILIVAAVVGFAMFGDSNPFASDAGYSPSDEVLNPAEISKNPYQWKGHSGILDTAHVFVHMPNGQNVPIPYPGGGLKFEKMIDEHVATYSVMAAEEEVIPDGEIAVELPDSTPPDPRQMWRVFVEGPMDAVNGLGTKIQVSEVKFEGYYTPPAQPVAPAPPQTPDPQQAAPADAPPTTEPQQGEPTQAPPDNSTQDNNNAPQTPTAPQQSPPN